MGQLDDALDNDAQHSDKSVPAPDAAPRADGVPVPPLVPVPLPPLVPVPLPPLVPVTEGPLAPGLDHSNGEEKLKVGIVRLCQCGDRQSREKEACGSMP